MSSGPTAKGRPAAGRRHDPRPPARRLIAMFCVLALGLVAILGRLFVLQVKDAAALQRMAVDQRLRTLVLPAPRGTIFDRFGRELAMSLPSRDVYIDPQLIADPVAEAATVAAALHLKARAVQKVMATRVAPNGQSIHFVYLERGVDLVTARALQAKNLPGVGFLSDTTRYYPAGPLAPQVLGVVKAFSGQGIAGLEQQYQNILAGRPGHEIVQEDPSGTLIPQAGSTEVPPVPGDDLVTTIDNEIQYHAQQDLEQAVRATRAKGGSVIVMDPHNGQILAMAVYPWFNPNNLATATNAEITNRAVSDVYEPGSVNKVVTASAVLQDHLVTLNTRFMVPDQITRYGAVIHDAEIHPIQPMTLGDIVGYSSNVGIDKVASLLGPTRFYSWLRRFGFGRPTGIDFPGEAAGILPPLSQWNGLSMWTIPFGQGIAVTPLQMACVYATIANGGVWVQPSLVRGTIGPGGQYQAAPAPDSRRVVSQRTASEVARILSYGVDFGTGVNAQIPGYWVAGKTGTAQVPLPNGKGYAPGKYDASFIGFTPASKPQIVVAVVIDQPAIGYYGGAVAAPVFKDVARFALARLHVPPAAKPLIPPHAVPAG